jgi:hypothetical protein
MSWKFFNKSKSIEEIRESLKAELKHEIKSELYIGGGRVAYNPILDDIFDGEKTPGELGAVYDSVPDYLRLRLRAYDMNLKTDIIKIITGKFFKWVVGSGLKLQSEPEMTVLEMSNIKLDSDKFQREVEALFNLYAKSKYSDYHMKDWLHKKASEAFNTSFLGGDVLCIIRFGQHGPNIQVIDGQQVQTPLDEKGKVEGNIIKHGIELNSKGEHVAFWVAVQKNPDVMFSEHKRIEAKNSEGIEVAWMVYGGKERIDHHRGIPKITSILEKVAKLDRFVEASVTKAEQTANVVYAFQHEEASTGENILTQSLTGKRTSSSNDESVFEKNGRTAAMLRQMASGAVLNLTPNSKLISLSNPNETTFNEFFRAIFTTICASVDIPEEVALQKYEQNYSSSRAAINGWEHIVEVYRQEFSKKFYEPFYKAWLYYQILSETIKAPGYLESKRDKKVMVLEAFENARFTGKKMPHIDPLKEAKAIRAMLGDDVTALISFEQATESLGSGDWLSNYKKHLEELKIVPKPEINDTDQNNSKNPTLESKPKK